MSNQNNTLEAVDQALNNGNSKNDVIGLEEESNSENTFTLFSSEQAGFTIELPDYFVMTETEESPQYPDDAVLQEYVKSQVVLTVGSYTEGYDNRIVFSYAKPEIYGKGGACVDEKGDSSYVPAVIAGKSMEVCKSGLTLSASYIDNPNQKIEYVISVYADSQDQFDTMLKAISNNLTFN